MKSFKDYVKIRAKPVSEMAVAPIMRGDKELRQHVKTPIQFDQDDINFLKQVPPQFWAQALNRRYSILLYETYNLHKKDERMPEDVDIEVIYKSGTKIKFRVRNAKMNELYEELDGMEDADRYSKLRPEDLADEESIRKGYYSNPDGSERTRITRSDGIEKKLSKYGFDLEGLQFREPRPGNPFYEGQAKGYVIPGQVVCRDIIRRWTDTLDEGWHDDELEGTRAEVSFGGGVGGRGKKNPETTKNLPVVADEKGNAKLFHFTGVGTTRGGKKGSTTKSITFTSYMPDIKQGFHLDKATSDVHDEYLEISKKLKSTTEFDDYINLLNKDFKDNPGFELDSVLNEKEVKELFEKLKILKGEKNKEEIIKIKKLLEFVAYLKDEKNKKEFTNRYKAFSNLTDNEIALKNAIQRTLEEVAEYVNRKRINVTRSATRYNVHQWNAFRHGGQRSPHTLVGKGGFWTVLKQQPGVYYEKLRVIFENNDEQVNEFWNHLTTDLGLTSICQAGAKESINRQKDDLARIVVPGKLDVEGIYIKSLKEAMLENIESIAKNALEQFLNKAGIKISEKYAEKFKEQVVDGGVSIDEFKKANNKSVITISRRAQSESSNYAIQVWQLQKRFIERKYDRDQTRRPENPHGDISKYNLLEIIEKFHSGEWDAEMSPGRTSHAIDVLEKAFKSKTAEIQQSIESGNFVKIQTDQKGNKKRKSVNESEDEKEMNKGIFRKTIDLVVSRIGSATSRVSGAVIGGLGAAAARVSGAVGGSLQRLKSIVGSRQIRGQETQGQETQGQETQGQETQGQETQGSSSMDKLRSIFGRRRIN